MRIRGLRSFALALAPALLGWPCVMNAIDFTSASDAPAKATHSKNARPVPDEDALRPGLGDFQRALDAVESKQFDRAVDLYEASASWGYKPAQYNLAMLYVIGEGIAVDKPRALAWAALAAERGDENYSHARELIYSELTAEEFARANAIWRGLKKTYADAIALDRAKRRLAQLEETTATPHTGTMAANAVDAREDDVARKTRPVDAGSRIAAANPSANADALGADVRQQDSAPTPESIDVPLHGGGDAD